jgi:Ca2+/H+ antiporter, TMEM165/GDT1 family
MLAVSLGWSPSKMFDSLLLALGAGSAVALELLEAAAIVMAVGLSRRWSDALIGAAAAILVCAAVALAAGPLLLESLPEGPLEVAIGVLLLLFGLEWLRKGTLRIAGRKARSSALREHLETREQAEALPPPAPGRADWAARAVAFKGVLLEGVEVILIVTALAQAEGARVPVIVGAAAAVLAVAVAGVWLRGPLSRLPETELKYGVGLVLSSFGVVFLAEGAGASWPGGDLALLYCAAALALATQLQAHTLSRGPAPGVDT